MGDFLLKINNTLLGKGGDTGDDEDSLNEFSGSGDGTDDFTNFATSWSPVKPSTRRPLVNHKDSKPVEQSYLWIYIIAACFVLVIIVIIIVVVVLCCRKRARARRKRQKSHLSSQGPELKAMTGNKETRVFANIPSSEAMDRQRIEHERAISRSLAPPPFVAPPPPKARAAPEAEKLLKAGQSPQDRPQPELAHLLASAPQSESANHYEEILSMTVTNEAENEQFLTGNIVTSTDSSAKSSIKDAGIHQYEEVVIKPEKPRKSPRKTVLKESSRRNQKTESAV